MSNKCPYCGAAVNRTMFNRFGKTEGYQALCRECGAIGPTNVVADDMAQKATIAMFTQPAHLMASLQTYDPATEVKVSREAAASVLELIDAWAERLNNLEAKPTWGIVPDYEPNVAELRAALEVK